MEDILKSLFQSLQNFIIPFIVRNILKIGGAVLAYAGWEESDITYIAAGIVAIVFGAVLSFVRDKILKTK